MQNITLENVLYNAFQHYTNNLYTAIPCIVLTVYNNLEDQKVDVQPCVNQKTYEGDSTEHPPILGVPVVFPASSTSAFTFPINKGDTVLCVFSSKSTDVFKSGSGYPSDPNDFRRFDKRDAVAIPGLFPFQAAVNNPKKRTFSHSTQDAVLVHNIGTGSECEVRLKANGDIVANSPTKFEVNAPDVVVNSDTTTVNADTATINAPTTDINATTTTVTSPSITMVGNVSIDGNLSVTSGHTGTFNGSVSFVGGTVSHNGKSIGDTHKHSGVQTGGGQTGNPV